MDLTGVLRKRIVIYFREHYKLGLVKWAFVVLIMSLGINFDCFGSVSKLLQTSRSMVKIKTKKLQQPLDKNYSRFK